MKRDADLTTSSVSSRVGHGVFTRKSGDRASGTNFVIATCFVSLGAAYFFVGFCVMEIEGDSVPATSGALRLKRIRRAGDQSLVRALAQSRFATVKIIDYGQSAE